MEKIVQSKNNLEFILRPIRSSDREEIKNSLLKLSSTSIGQRFFAMKSGFSEDELNFLTEVDDYQHLAYVAIFIDSKTQELEGAGVVRAVRSKTKPDEAEIALTIIDKYQGIGLGLQMLTFLSERAEGKNIKHFTGSLQRTNTPMLRLLTKFSKLTTFPKEGSIIDFKATLPFKQ